VSLKPSARIAVYIGGSFTDIALDHDNSLFTTKTPTTQNDPVRGVIDVIRIASANANCAADQITAEGSSCIYDLPMRDRFDATSSKDTTRFAVVLKHNGSVDKQASRQQRKP
jgi:hypothetical protein